MTAHTIVPDRTLPLALAATLLANAFILAVIAFAKLRRGRREAFAARVRDRMTGELIDFLETGGEPPRLPAARSLAGQTVLETAVSLIGALKGEARDALIALLERAGYIGWLLRLLRSRDWITRARAAALLGASQSAQAVSALTQSLLNDNAPEVRITAAEALGTIGSPASVEVLLTALREPSRYQGLRIAVVLAQMGSVAVPAIEQALSEDDSRLTILLLNILADAGMTNDPAKIAALLEHRSPEVRARAAAVLGAAGALDALPALLFASRDALWFVRLRVIKALALLGMPHTEPEAGRYIETLTHLTYDEAWAVRRNAAAALALCGSRGERALKSLGSDVARSALDLNSLHQGRASATVL